VSVLFFAAGDPGHDGSGHLSSASSSTLSCWRSLVVANGASG
jgi:hypothetical protein